MIVCRGCLNLLFCLASGSVTPLVESTVSGMSWFPFSSSDAEVCFCYSGG